MQVDISLPNAKIYNIERFEVVKGQKFSLFTDSGIPLKWFANNDQVLDITDNDSTADVAATANGEVIILIMDKDLKTVKQLNISVVDAIIEPARILNATADAAILKDAAPAGDGSFADLLK